MSMVEQMSNVEPPPGQKAQEGQPASRLIRLMNYLPRALASKPHIIFLAGLGIYLVLFPLVGLHVSAFAELVGGNYTNVTSDLGACIAAGGTIHIMRSQRRHRIEIERLNRLLHEVHVKVHATPEP
jgi:hypothetical protein